MSEQKKKVLVCTPSHDGKLNVGYSMGAFDLIRQKNDLFYYDFFFSEYSSDIMKARNQMLWYFYHQTEHDFLLFIDSDEGFTAQAVYDLLRETADYEISAIPVPLKQLHPDKIIEWVAMEFQDDERQALDVKQMLPSTYEYNHSGDKSDMKDDRYIYVDKVGTGFMCIPRNVIELMIEHFDTSSDIEFEAPLYTDKMSGNRCYSFFSHVLHKDKILGEDFSFCMRAREVGIPLKVDTYLKADHYGTFRWEGNTMSKKLAQKTRKKIIKKFTEK